MRLEQKCTNVQTSYTVNAEIFALTSYVNLMMATMKGRNMQLPTNLHRLANKLYLVVFMTVYHHSIYCEPLSLLFIVLLYYY
jgi:hypothetical protein